MEQIRTAKRQRPRKINPKRWNGTLTKCGNDGFHDIIGVHEERGFAAAFKTNNCAPEQFKAFVNGKQVYIGDTFEYTHMLAKEGPQKVFDVLKRRYREERRPRPTITTYGYYIRDNPRSCLTANGFRGQSNDLQSRLSAYKGTKAVFEKNEWRHRDAQTATLDGKYNISSVEDCYLEADPASPVVFHHQPDGRMFVKNLK